MVRCSRLIAFLSEQDFYLKKAADNPSSLNTDTRLGYSVSLSLYLMHLLFQSPLCLLRAVSCNFGRSRRCFDLWPEVVDKEIAKPSEPVAGIFAVPIKILDKIIFIVSTLL